MEPVSSTRSPVTLTDLLIEPPVLTDMRSSSFSKDPTISQHVDGQMDEDDIYRGIDPRSPQITSPDAVNVGTSDAGSAMARSTRSDTSSSSSSSSGIGFNIIPSIIEHAITRWARRQGLRRRDSTSSSDSSATSSTISSSSDQQQQHHRKRKQKRSTASLYSHTTSLTTRRQARVASRASPRGFTLYLPSHLTVPPSRFVERGALKEEELGDSIKQSGELRTASLKLVLAHLGAALKRNAKTTRRPFRNATLPTSPPAEESGPSTSTPRLRPQSYAGQKRKTKDDGPHVAFDLPPETLEGSPLIGPMTEPRKNKNKGREVPRQFFLQEKRQLPLSIQPRSQPCWWLEVASPTWDDMRALGKLLQLHPLTLEDILQKESREKFELFPRLGYYFIVFRAIERPNADVFPEEDDDASSTDGLPEMTEVLDITNVYLVVFKEGICIFHFEDISMHMDSVRKKIFQLQETVPMGSDWIAHGLMDSIVDAFFPVLKDISKEVELVEELVSGLEQNQGGGDEFHPIDRRESPATEGTAVNSSSSPETPMLSEKILGEKEKEPIGSLPTEKKGRTRPLRYYTGAWWLRLKGRLRTKDPGASTLNRDLNRLRRMTTTRRLVTTLGRLLSSKADVIAQLRKRLDGQGEVYIYFGDVQDHIISLHQSLIHYERMLSHSHPAYLSHLRFSLDDAKGGLDKALILLALVSVLILCSQLIAQIGGMNVTVPKTETTFTAFGVFLAFGGLNEAKLSPSVTAVKELVTDANFDCDDEGIRLQAMDNSHVALVSLNLKSEGFEEYRCDRPMTLGVNIASLTKVIKCAKDDDEVTLSATDQADTINLVYNAKGVFLTILPLLSFGVPGLKNGFFLRRKLASDRVANYELKLMDIDQETLGIPETEYDATVTLPSAEFARLCRDLSALGESVKIEVSKEGIRFTSEGDSANGSVLLKAEGAAGARSGGSSSKTKVKKEEDEDAQMDEDASEDDGGAQNGDEEEEEEEEEGSSKKRKRSKNSSDKAPKGKAKKPRKEDDSETGVTLVMSQQVNLTFSLKYLQNFAKSSSLCSRVTLSMSNEVPLLVEYNFGQGVISYFLAPKIE
ncbi:proliferating cell nuclear antigen [Serendipita sp. 399]|nr:proliferating cell nuclear antigen [Serendipita sp. 399]